MIVDTSALVAILKSEPEARSFRDRLRDASEPVSISSASLLEASIVIDGGKDAILSAQLDEIISDFAIIVAPFTEGQSRLAREAYRQYGKGSGNPAQLNFGDCFAYALAIDTDQPLLFKGEDFSKTDVKIASV